MNTAVSENSLAYYAPLPEILMSKIGLRIEHTWLYYSAISSDIAVKMSYTCNVTSSTFYKFHMFFLSSTYNANRLLIAYKSDGSFKSSTKI